MLTKISEFVKGHLNDIILSIVIILLIMLSFAMGYIMGIYHSKTPIQIEQTIN